jgi:hypothetical protein
MPYDDTHPDFQNSFRPRIPRDATANGAQRR